MSFRKSLSFLSLTTAVFFNSFFVNMGTRVLKQGKPQRIAGASTMIMPNALKQSTAFVFSRMFLQSSLCQSLPCQNICRRQQISKSFLSDRTLKLANSISPHLDLAGSPYSIRSARGFFTGASLRGGGHGNRLGTLKALHLSTGSSPSLNLPIDSANGNALSEEELLANFDSLRCQLEEGVGSGSEDYESRTKQLRREIELTAVAAVEFYRARERATSTNATDSSSDSAAGSRHVRAANGIKRSLKTRSGS
jgi:hypothetical protein